MGVGPLEPPLGRRTLPVASSPALAAEGGCARPDPAAPLPPARCGDPARRELMKGGSYGVVLALTLARTPCGNPDKSKRPNSKGYFWDLFLAISLCLSLGRRRYLRSLQDSPRRNTGNSRDMVLRKRLGG